MLNPDRQAMRRHYLKAMGITVWTRRDAPPPTPLAPLNEAVVPTAPPPEAQVLRAAPPPDVQPLRDIAPAVTNEPVRQEPQPSPLLQDPLGDLDWEALQRRVKGCEKCAELVANRSRTVFGVGNRSADWMVIGEAPGADEDRQGEPFVGRAGQLLNAMLQAAGFPRDQVYIANILKCRPPNNRDPKPEEAAACEGFLHRQIALVRPKLILVVGRIAAQRLLDTQVPVGRLRGQVHRYGEGKIPLVVTYHPAYLLRSLTEKRKAWDDLRLAMTAYREASSPR